MQKYFFAQNISDRIPVLLTLRYLRSYWYYVTPHLIILARSKYESRYRCCNCSYSQTALFIHCYYCYLIRSRIVIVEYLQLIVRTFLSARWHGFRCSNLRENIRYDKIVIIKIIPLWITTNFYFVVSLDFTNYCLNYLLR